MKRYVKTDSDKRIIITSCEGYGEEGMDCFDFPEDFDFSCQQDYRLIGKSIVFDKFEREDAPIEMLRAAENELSLSDGAILCSLEQMINANNTLELIEAIKRARESCEGELQKRKLLREKIARLEAKISGAG